MAATWTITNCENFILGPESAGPFEDHDNVIFRLHWECVDEVIVSDETYRVREYGAVGLQPFEGGAFIPLEDVTEEQALSWLHDRMGADEVTRIEENVNLYINKKINPTTESGIPW